MENRVFKYYRAGVELAILQLEGGKVLCTPRDMQSMEYGPRVAFCWPMAPFSAELDKRLPDALAIMQAGSIPSQGYDLAYDGADCQRYIEKYGNNPLDLILSNGRIVAAMDNERNYLGILVEQGQEGLTPLANLEKEGLSKPEYGVEYMGTQMVAMRDGVRLATDVYLPAQRKAGQRFPAVLIRTCYNKFSASQFFCFVHYGYAVVSQDTRGRELSEGVWEPIIHEKDDGDDTLKWIAAQEWSDGSVGMIGASYLAIVQWQAAASGNKNLKAIISMVTGGVPMFDFPHRAGVLSPGTIAWCVSMRNKNFAPEDMEREDWDDILAIRPIKDIPRKGIHEEIPFWNAWMEHEYYDGYWHNANFLAHQHLIDVPAMYVTGWYDDVGPGSMQVWDMNRRNGRKNQKLICGAWKHKMNISRDIHNNYYGADAIRYDMFYQYLRWYDRFLKGIPNGIEGEPPVDYFVIGENAWKTAGQWPPETAKDTPIYLASAGKANTRLGDGSLSFTPDATAGADHFVYDPADPAPFLIDVSENECLVPENYRDVEMRQDVLVYTSAPLSAPITIAGEPTAVLYAASSAKDTDWVVRITDVDEKGNSIRLCDGIIRAKFRKSFIEPKLLLPNEIVRYEIPLTWISNTFAAGHCIRVEITSGAANSVFPNTNTGLPAADAMDTVIANQTVYHGGSQASYIILPIIDAAECKQSSR